MNPSAPPTPSEGYALVKQHPDFATDVKPGDQFWSCVDQRWKDSEISIMSRGHHYQRPITDAAPADAAPADAAPADAAPAEAPQPEAAPSEWRPIKEFNGDEHLPCWVTVAGIGGVDIACVDDDGRPESFDMSRLFDEQITHFLPLKKPEPPAPEPVSPERQAFDAWWDALAEKPTTQDIAWDIWEAANHE